MSDLPPLAAATARACWAYSYLRGARLVASTDPAARRKESDSDMVREAMEKILGHLPDLAVICVRGDGYLMRHVTADEWMLANTQALVPICYPEDRETRLRAVVFVASCALPCAISAETHMARLRSASVFPSDSDTAATSTSRLLQLIRYLWERCGAPLAYVLSGLAAASAGKEPPRAPSMTLERGDEASLPGKDGSRPVLKRSTLDIDVAWLGQLPSPLREAAAALLHDRLHGSHILQWLPSLKTAEVTDSGSVNWPSGAPCSSSSGGEVAALASWSLRSILVMRALWKCAYVSVVNGWGLDGNPWSPPPRFPELPCSLSYKLAALLVSVVKPDRSPRFALLSVEEGEHSFVLRLRAERRSADDSWMLLSSPKLLAALAVAVRSSRPGRYASVSIVLRQDDISGACVKSMRADLSDERKSVEEFPMFEQRARFGRNLCSYPQCKTAAAGASLQRCSRCKKAAYCGRDCQVSHWKAAHKRVCKHLKKLKLPVAAAECLSAPTPPEDSGEDSEEDEEEQDEAEDEEEKEKEAEDAVDSAAVTVDVEESA